MKATPQHNSRFSVALVLIMFLVAMTGCGPLRQGNGRNRFLGLGACGFWAWVHVAISGGYRALGYQFEESKGDSNFELDLLVHGPINGIRFGF